MYIRIIKKSIKNHLFKKKIIILYGPRQVGKTTLVKELLEEFNGEKLYISCDIPSRRALIIGPEPAILKQNFGNAKLVIIDEAQLIENIGVILKVFVDTYPDIQIIATGSSSFDLANKIREPLTGRAFEYMLYPLSYEEIASKNNFTKQDKGGFRMRFGWYPGISESIQDATEQLEILQNNTLYKDIFTLEQIKKPKVLQDIVLQLAYRIGTVISVQNLADEIKTTPKTVERYIDLLEKMFVLIRIYPYSRNPSNERKKGYKVYFIDIGIRNSIIKDHKALNLRNDIGALFENYFIMERIKYLSNNFIFTNKYFWQNYLQEEVDYIEEKDGILTAFECKYTERSSKSLYLFQNTYKESVVKIISQKNYQDFIKNNDIIS